MKTRKIIFILLLAICVSISGCKCDKKIKTIQLKITDDPIISFRFLFHTGAMQDPAGKNGLTSLTANLLAEGSTQKNKYEDILKKLYPIASGYGVRVDREYTIFSGRSHKDNIDIFYTLFKEALLEPAFLEEDFTRVKTATINYLKNTFKYGDDEELGKAVFKAYMYKGTPYENNVTGKIADLEKITLEDVKAFYKENFTRGNLIAGISGNFDDALIGKINKDFAALPECKAGERTAITPEEIAGLNVQIVEKDTESTGIHIGFPIKLIRGDEDFHALFLANQWFGVHRNSSSHLYRVIREVRGMNYGDYSYIEDFPMGGRRMMPPANAYKNPQLFEIWIRPVENKNRLFALRAALRELKKLVDNGLTQEEFDLTQKSLTKYYLHFASTNAVRLGYKIDDYIFGLKAGHLENFRKNVEALTLEKVNRAIKKHLQYDNLKIVFVSNEAEALKEALVNSTPSPITYRSPKPAAVLEEDKIIEVFPLKVKAENVEILKLDDVFK
ncbi:MAG: insulinase family protein [Candidatus Aminicenantes bacterium]|nr:insulinase family protein [Candidatus Aminicenantes bacterium]